MTIKERPSIGHEAHSFMLPEENDDHSCSSDSGPDSPITSTSEIAAFYIYNIALSAVGQLGLVVAFPLILNGLASGVGVLEGTTYPCSDGEELKKNGTLSNIPSCMVTIGRTSIATSAYANYVISFSVFLQALLYISIASFGDYGNWRKKFLVIFGLLGCFSAMAMPAAYQPSLHWLAAVFVIFVNLFQGSSYVFLDGYFPILVRNDPKVRLNEESFDEKANKVSMIGNTTGFATSILFQAISLLVMMLISDEIMILQLMITATGIWWFFLGIYTFIYLKERPGPPLPKGYSNYILFSWTTVIKSIAKWKQIPNTFLYLLAFFFYSDGMHTLSQIAILFCSEKLKLSNRETIVVSTIFPISALLGNVALVYVQKAFKISTKTMLLSTLSVMSIVPLYALIGAFNDKFGLVRKEEAYVVALFGCIFGAVQSFGKVLFAELIPEGCESEFFALSAISDRGSSWIGPLMVGAITQVSHDIRFGMVSIAILFVIALPLIYLIDVEKGKKDSLNYTKEMRNQEKLIKELSSTKEEDLNVDMERSSSTTR